MKSLRIAALFVAFSALFVGAATAQYQVPNHSVPIGRGGGNIGYGNAAPGTTGQPLVSNGASADPSFQAYGALRFDQSQSLTTSQQDQIRQNAGIFTGGGYANIFANATGANTVSISADAVMTFDAAGHAFGVNNIGTTLNMATSGAGGLDTGSVGTNGYYYFVIYNPTAGTANVLASLSPTAPTMPSGYTYKRRIGWLNYNSGITTFVQRNAQFSWSGARTVASGTVSSPTAFSLATFVSPTATRVYGVMVTNNNNVLVEDNAGNPIANINSVTSGQCFYNWTFTPLNTTYQVTFQSSSPGGAVSVTGWEDSI